MKYLSHIAKTALLLLLSFTHLSCTASKKTESEQFVRCIYRPSLLFVSSCARYRGEDPLADAKTPEQRRFLVEYYRVMDKEYGTVRKDHSYQYMEPLRRCGITFPKGTFVSDLPTDPPLLVVHTPATVKQIKKIMGLESAGSPSRY